MYTWELKNFVSQRNGKVSREEYIKVVNQVDNPQIVDVTVENINGVAKTIVTTSDEGSFSFLTDWM